MNRLACVLTVAVAVLCSASGASLTLDVPLEVGAPLHLDCGVSGHYRHCLWETEDGRVYQVQDVHGGRHAGLRAPNNLTNNQCGIVVERASLGDAGAWTCTVFLQGEALRTVTNVINKEGRACQSPFMPLGSGCYFFGEVLSWYDARSYCKALKTGADLAVVDDCDMMNPLWNYITNTYGQSTHWLGASDEYQEGTWLWVDGSAVTLGTPYWTYGEPNNDPAEEDCMAMYANQGGYFNDLNCVNIHRFVCQDMTAQPLHQPENSTSLASS